MEEIPSYLMGDNFIILVDVEATADNAEAISSTILTKFHEIGLITGELSKDWGFGGMGYLLGPAIPDLYDDKYKGAYPAPYCGVQPRVGRNFNWSALGPTGHYLLCPSCGFKIEDENSETHESLMDNISLWMKGAEPLPVPCPGCQKHFSIFEWQSKEPLALGYVSFRFWNWPDFDSPAWKIDIPGLVHEITGHKIVVSYGHL